MRIEVEKYEESLTRAQLNQRVNAKISTDGFNILILRHSTIGLRSNTNLVLGIGCYDLLSGRSGLTQNNAVFGFMAFQGLAKPY